MDVRSRFPVALLLILVEILNHGYSATVEDVARLHLDLFSNYSRVIPPVYQQNHAIHVNFSLFLLMIHDLDMKNQVLTTSGWLNVNWEDEFLRWNETDYGGVEEITVSQSHIWLPDILVENTAQNFAELGSDSILVSIKSNGVISWEPGILTKTICEVNIGKYPFDYQMCEIKFLTWMHTNKTLDVMPGSEKVSLDACIPNGEWDIKTANAQPYFYPSTYKPGTAHTGVKFIIELARKRTFYVLNTIIPVVMLSFLNVLVFLLPASSGEKMALAVTVLLSFTVYLSIISEVMPKTSESISILAVYLTTLLSLSTMSVLSSGLVMNMVNQDPDKPVPPLLKGLVCCKKTKQSSREFKKDSLRRKANGTTSSSSTRKRNGEKDRFNFTYLQNDITLHDVTSSSPPWQNNEEMTSLRKNRNVTATPRDSEATRVFPMHDFNFRNEPHGHHHHHHLHDSQDLDSMIYERDIDDVRFENRPHYPSYHDGGSRYYDRDGGSGVSYHRRRRRSSVSWHDVGSAVDTLLFWVFLLITVSSTSTVLFLFSYQ